MPTLLRGPLMGPMTQFVQHPMVPTFRALAARHARRAALIEPWVGSRLDRGWLRLRELALKRFGTSDLGSLIPGSVRDAVLESSLLAHIYACMASEAATDEIAAELLRDDEVEDFDRCKKKYGGRPAGVPLLVWKWKILLEHRGRPTDVAEPAFAELRVLVEDRNALIHYSLMDSATRLVFDRTPPIDTAGMVVVWSAHEPPTRVEEGRILRLLRADAAAQAVRRAEDVFAIWNAVARRSPASAT
jgi:hypothetical protein